MSDTFSKFPASSASHRVASPIHTIMVLAVLTGWAFYHKLATQQLAAAPNPNRVRFYLITFLFEWLLFALVLACAHHRGASVLTVLSDHWHSVRQLLRDIGIALAFWMVAALLLPLFGSLLRVPRPLVIVSMLPQLRHRTCILDSALHHRRHVRGDDLSRLPATPVHRPD